MSNIRKPMMTPSSSPDPLKTTPPGPQIQVEVGSPPLLPPQQLPRRRRRWVTWQSDGTRRGWRTHPQKRCGERKPGRGGAHLRRSTCRNTGSGTRRGWTTGRCVPYPLISYHSRGVIKREDLKILQNRQVDRIMLSTD